MSNEPQDTIHPIFQEEDSDWSRYQLLVLQQLEDHSLVLSNLNKEIIEIKQFFAVHKTESNIWRDHLKSQLEKLQQEVDTNKEEINNIQRSIDVEEQSSIKHKATTALYGSIAMFVANIIMQLITAYIKK